MTSTIHNGKPYAGNPHVRFDEGDVASAVTPRRGSLLYKALSTVICSFGATFGLAVSASAGNVTIPWDASATPTTLGNAETGLLEFTYTDGELSNITAYPVDGGTIVMTGDQINVFGDSHVIMVAGGELVFSNVVNGAWNLHVESTSGSSTRTIVYSGVDNTSNLDIDSYKTLFPNRNLAEWAPLSTGSEFGWFKGDVSPVYNIRKESDGTVTAQRQKVFGDLVCVVKFQLKQIGDDIAGRVCYAGYWDKDKGAIGLDSDAAAANPQKYNFKSQTVAISGSSGGYGISKITMSRTGGLPTVRFAGGLDLTYRLYAGSYTHLIFERAGTGDVKGGYHADPNGVLTFLDPKNNLNPCVNAAGTGIGMFGNGTFVFEASDALYGDETHDMFSDSHSGWLTTDWVTVAESRQLPTLTGGTACFGGGSMAGSWKGQTMTLECLSIAEDGQTATGQFQILFGGWYGGVTNRCAAVFVAFKQNGQDVQMRATTTRCYGDNTTSAADASAKYGTDLTNQGSAFALSTDGSDGSYGAGNPTLQFAHPVKIVTMNKYPGFLNVVGSSSVPGGKASLIIRGTDNTTMRYATAYDYAVPGENGLLSVQNGGEAVLQKNGSSTTVRWTFDRSWFRIEEGGVFSQQNNWGVGWTQNVEIVCGDFRAYDLSSLTMGQSVLNFVTFSGGTHLYSARGGASDFVRAGYNMDSVWTVRGTTPSTCDVGLKVWGADGGNTMTFAVNEVTGTPASDFIMNGVISRDANQTAVLGVYKTGSGTMELNASYNVATTPTLLKGGTWLFNASTLASASSPYTIDGGTLAVADGTTNSVGILTVGENGGGINLGAGAMLTFADSSAAEWSGTLLIKGFRDGAVRFGTSAAALTDEQVTMLRAEKPDGTTMHLCITSDGYLALRGMVISIR